ncbi:hypothetical protein Droror1_Dr00023870 [Drosera rotundifolia]
MSEFQQLWLVHDAWFWLWYPTSSISDRHLLSVTDLQSPQKGLKIDDTVIVQAKPNYMLKVDNVEVFTLLSGKDMALTGTNSKSHMWLCGGNDNGGATSCAATGLELFVATVFVLVSNCATDS